MYRSIFRIFEKSLKIFLLSLIRLYRYTLSPYLGRYCRFYPTCSCYAIEALNKHSIGKALFLVIRRLLHCRPFGKSGYDPVPQSKPRS